MDVQLKNSSFQIAIQHIWVHFFWSKIAFMVRIYHSMVGILGLVNPTAQKIYDKFVSSVCYSNCAPMLSHGNILWSLRKVVVLWVLWLFVIVVVRKHPMCHRMHKFHLLLVEGHQLYRDRWVYFEFIWVMTKYPCLATCSATDSSKHRKHLYAWGIRSSYNVKGQI